MRFAIIVLLAVVSAGAPTVCAGEVSGAGSTAAFPVIAAWANAYGRETESSIRYQPIGSSLGLEQAMGASVDFGVIDSPLRPDQLEIGGLLQFPLVIGGVVPVVNVPGVAPGRMRFTGRLLSDIYLGHIRRWNDPALVAVNPGLVLPDQPITVVYRSDGSGTTGNWSRFLAGASEEWKAKVGQGNQLAWPVGAGSKGNAGVAEYVRRIKGTIGYVEFSYVLQSGLVYGLVRNREGHFVAPTPASFRAAAESMDWLGVRSFSVTLTDAPGAAAWPLTAVSFVVVRRVPPDARRLGEAVHFFEWAMRHGQDAAVSLGYATLPDTLVAAIAASWQAEIH